MSSNDPSSSGVSGLTIAVIVLPVVTVALAGVLFLVARAKKDEEEGGGGNTNGEKGNVDTR